MKGKKYRFIGADGSMRLRNGKVYRLQVFTQTWLERLRGRYTWPDKVVAINLDSMDTFTPIMPYSSTKSFEKNWEKVQ